jgi:hypothetical protein
MVLGSSHGDSVPLGTERGDNHESHVVGSGVRSVRFNSRARPSDSRRRPCVSARSGSGSNLPLAFIRSPYSFSPIPRPGCYAQNGSIPDGRNQDATRFSVPTLTPAPTPNPTSIGTVTVTGSGSSSALVYQGRSRSDRVSSGFFARCPNCRTVASRQGSTTPHPILRRDPAGPPIS